MCARARNFGCRVWNMQDLGFNAVGFTKELGAKPEALTPFMDKLVATEGRLLTHHYVYRLCAPTRAMLM